LFDGTSPSFTSQLSFSYGNGVCVVCLDLRGDSEIDVHRRRKFISYYRKTWAGSDR